MRTGHQETERKFDGSGDAALPALEGIPGVAEVTDADPEDLDAIYYDTTALGLLAHGVTLRRRTGGHDAGWHLKLPAGPDRRDEIQLPLDAGAPGLVPSELVLRTRAFARGEELFPIVHLRTHRRRRILLDDSRRELVEIAQDTVSAQVLGADRLKAVPSGDKPLVPPQRGSGGSRGGSTVITGWTEVEAELVEGGTGLLDAVERRFAQAGLRRSTSSSKLARALGRPVPAGSTAAEPRPGSVGAAVTALIRGQAAELLAIDPEVRADEPDAVHRMRVAARRLRSTLRIHRGLLADESAGAVAEGLRRLGRILGEARDQEVLGARLGAEIERLTAEECPGPVRERVAAWSAERYRASWTQADAALDSPRYYALLDAVEALAERPALRRRARRGAVAEFRRTARREQLRVGRRLTEAVATPPGQRRDEALHLVRKAAKRARYAGEGAVPSAGKPAKRYARRMKAVQELLGVRQDALLACAALPGLAASAHQEGEPGFGYGLLFERNRAEAARVDHELPEVWKAARKPGLTRFG